MNQQRRRPPPQPPRARRHRSGRSRDERRTERMANLALRAKRLRDVMERIVTDQEKDPREAAKVAIQGDNQLRGIKP